MPQYQGIPTVPNGQIPQWQYDLLLAMKENIEIMMGQRGPGRAVTNDTVQVVPQAWQKKVFLEARGDWTTNAAVGVPTINDYRLLLNDVQILANDVGRIQDALTALIDQMRK